MDDTRRTIDELVTRYELEPDLKDIYVEGDFDKEILCHYFKCNNTTDRTVYVIDSVNIPYEILMKNGLTEGNKQRVIALARELSSIPENGSLKFLVDKDLDHWLGEIEKTGRLIWTDFCSMELYFFNEDILKDIILTTAKAKIKDWDIYLNSMINALKQIYTLRLVDKDLGLSFEWIPLDKYLTIENSKITFDLSRYVKNLLNKNHKHAISKQFSDSFTIWESKLLGDFRNYIHGHDSVTLIAWSIKTSKGISAFSTPEALERLHILLANRVPQFEYIFN